jgi:hypothetical protein
MHVQPFLSVVFICSITLESNSQAGHKSSAILISDFDLLKHWRATHSLDEYSAILISGSDQHKCLIVTHSLDVCSAILVSGDLESNSQPG